MRRTGLVLPVNEYDFPRVGLAAILLREKEFVLLSKRICPHANGMYGFPGGHLELW